MSTDKEQALHSIVLINAIWKAAQELPLDKVMSICEQTCWNIKEHGLVKNEIDCIVLDELKDLPKDFVVPVVKSGTIETFFSYDLGSKDKCVIAEFEKNDDGSHTFVSISDEADAKQLDDAQRYRDHKNDC